MKITDKFQYSDKKLTDKQCEEFHKAWQSHIRSGSPIYWHTSSPVGKQVMDWLHKQNNGITEKAHFYRQSFQEFTSPIDGKRIASTADLRNHEREYRVKQVGNDLLTTKGKENDRHSDRAS